MVHQKFYNNYYILRILIVFLVFFYTSTVKAGLEGYGPIKLDPVVVKYFLKYMDAKAIQNANEGAQRRGKGVFFFVEENGKDFGYTYCAHAQGCSNDPLLALRLCKKNVKKHLKTKSTCKMFAKHRYIVWDNKKIIVPVKATSSEIKDTLRYQGYID